MFDTIAAISSGLVNQPISIVRVSGPDAFKIVSKIYHGKNGKHSQMTYGYIKDQDKVIDEVLIAWFKGPNSFTGEDIVEINAHGGIVNTNRILELLLINGARLAERGEFSRRAFLNNKMDLVKAEAIHDLIFAKTETQAQLAINKFDYQTSNYIKDIIKKLLTIIATIETNIDYPEYDDIEDLTQNILIPKLEKLIEQLTTTIKLSKDSRFVTEGVRVAIVGKPNVGKSTLLNTLLNDDKAIVTNLPGTTRDVVEGDFTYEGILFKLFDTAGIHKTNDLVEKKGIAKSQEEIKKADLVIHLLDASTDNTIIDKQIIKAAQNKIYLQIFNKNDLKKHDGLSISAKMKKIKPLLEALKKSVPQINLDDRRLVANARQLALIRQANNNIQEALNNLKQGFNPEEVIIDIRQAWKDLTNITGRADNEKLLDQMFKNFCLGK